MAGVDCVKKKLLEELLCSICLEFLKDPVTVSCGHNFCQACLAQCWGASVKEAPCPQCRQEVQVGDLRPNRQLANLVEIAQELSSQERGSSPRGEDQGWGRVCQKHQEPLRLFCQNQKAPICLVCKWSKEHGDHKVIPLEEAAEEYKDMISDFLGTLKKEKEEILASKADAEQESRDLLKQTETEKGKMVAQFRRIHQFLEEQEKSLVAQMEETETEISAKREEHLARLSNHLSSLESLTQEMEEKLQQPASELLWDIESFLQRYEKKEKFENPVAFPLDLKWKIWDFCDINPFLEGVTETFRDTLESGLQQQKAKVTLDPETAGPCLFLSEDCRKVTHADEPHDLPDNPKRFDANCVLGCEGFTAGRHFWDIVVASGGWSVGVASESVERKDCVPIGVEDGIWEIGKWNHAYKAYDISGTVFLPLKEKPKKIRVTLNYEGGRVAFYNADTAALIFEYLQAFFSETLLPFFFVEYKAMVLPP